MLLAGIASCRQHDTKNPDSADWQIHVPANLGGKMPELRFPITREGYELGKMLFFDPILSGNNTIACASCHKPHLAFTDGLALSDKGVSGKPLSRNTPSIVNTAWMSGLFWDGGAKDIESLALGPLEHEDEMNQNIHELVLELRNDSVYSSRFIKVFPDEGITPHTIIRSLGQFQNALVSGNSRYDYFRRSEAGRSLSSLELQGLALIEKHCASCHSSDLFTDNLYHNNGLDSIFSDDTFLQTRLGRYRITRDSNDLGKYKTPTLRNISLTAPYMHDGRFATLNEVLDHYSEGIKQSPTLDEKLSQPLRLSQHEKRAIAEFLHSLTDYSFSDPSVYLQ